MEYIIPLDFISVFVAFFGGGNLLPIFRFIFWDKRRQIKIQVFKYHKKNKLKHELIRFRLL